MILNLTKKKILDYAVTFGVEFLIMLISVALFKIIGKKFEQIGFSEYTVSKRFIGFVQPLLALGFGVSLPKYLAVEKDIASQRRIHYSVQIFLVLIFLFALLVSFIFKNLITQIVFGTVDELWLMLACLFYFLSLSIHTSVYNFFRGGGKYNLSAMMQFVNLGLLPLIVYFIATDIKSYFVLLSIISLFFSFSIQLFLIGKQSLEFHSSKKIVKEMFNYGYRRMPGDVIFSLFTSIPVFIAANYISLIEAGKIAFCMSLLNIIIAFMSPINIILLPESAKIIQQKKFAALSSINKKMTLLAALIGGFSIVVIIFLGKFLLHFFNVKDVENTFQYLIIIFTCVIGFSIYAVLRSIIDAYYSSAKNGMNVLICFILFLMSFGILLLTKHSNLTNLLICFSVSLNLLGIMTYFTTQKIFKSHSI